MVATQQQMHDAQLVVQQRDYCAHYLILLLKCKHGSFSNFLACSTTGASASTSTR